ncbi:MAG: lipocalin family protein [Pseudomonadota bacterium]|nr:lipocalin family protein [Pseudomonadota bacterium]
MVRTLLMTALMAAIVPAASTLPNQPVDGLDLQRYAGQWHEIAHLPMFFQRRCVDTITATYTPLPDGSIRVHNACRTRDGSLEAADGVAKKVAGRPAALKVRFAPDWLSWLPVVWADYWVVELDPDYQWAVVGGPSRKYMWVLSRRPSMDRALFEQIRERARQRRYPVDRLVMAAPLD